MKTKNLWKYGVTAFIVSLVGCSFFFYKQKKTYTKLSQSANKLISQEEANLLSLISAYKKKYHWVNLLYFGKNQAVNNTTNSEMYLLLSQLNSAQVKTQADLNKFELLNIKLNQALINEVIKYNSRQKSLFANYSQIRALERYDRHIDFTRTQYSSWSFQYYQTKTEIKKNFFSKNNSLAEIPFYEIDHLIFRKKSEKKSL